MKKRIWKSYAFWIILAEAAGGLSGWLTRDGARKYRLAAWLQVPYLLWVSFAAYLNLGIWMLN